MERVSRFARRLRHLVPPGARGGRREARNAAADADAARARMELLLTAARAGFPLAPAAHPSGYGCSCVRIGCPTPGRHPVSFGWQTQATTDLAQVERWADAQPQANFIAATGIDHDVLDVPADAGRAALKRLEAGLEANPEAALEPQEETPVGPVALVGGDRMLFFTATRGTPDDEDEWWPCELDCHPETMDEHPGLRWHCRGSYVLVPPARLPGSGERGEVRWVRPPVAGSGAGLGPLPEPLTLLEALTDACAEYAAESGEETAAWPVR